MKVKEEITNVAAVVQTADGRGWLRFSEPTEILQTYDLDEVLTVLEKAENRSQKQEQYVVGFVSYESANAFDVSLVTRANGDIPLIWFAVFSQAEEFDFPASSMKKDAKQELKWQAKINKENYAKNFNQINGYLCDGDVYQVNYTHRLHAKIVHHNSWDLFIDMVYAQNLVDQEGYCAFIDTDQWSICSASPELFFSLDNGKLLSKPMKGTAPRGLHYEDDEKAAKDLKHSVKNRAENIMISDMVRNDMGRIAQVGTVHVKDILTLQKYPTFWAMTTTVACQTKANLVKVFEALFPAASITGAPKIRASQVITELETLPRQVYTGSIGYIAPNGYSQFNVAIRTVIVNKITTTAEFGVGGGVVWDSSVEDEFSECLVKARVLTYSQPEFSLIETLRWQPQSGYTYLQEHLQRLGHSARYFSWKIDMKKIQVRLEQQVSNFPDNDMRVRLLVSKDNQVIVEASNFTGLDSPYKIKFANNPINSKNYFLYHKTSNRAVYAAAMSEALDCDDVILWNENDEITESCRANIIVGISNKKVTPPVECGLLPGIARQMAVERGDVTEQKITKQQLLEADGVWLINSVRDVWLARLVT